MCNTEKNKLVTPNSTRPFQQDRRLGCQLLLKLSGIESSPRKIVQRNADVLCQLVRLVEDEADHFKIVRDSLRQHLITFPRTTTHVLFRMNILLAREENEGWKSPCLTLLNKNLLALMADYIESEVELCKQIVEGWKLLKSQDSLRSHDVEHLLRLTTSLQLDMAKASQSRSISTVNLLCGELKDILCTLIILVVTEVVRGNDEKQKKTSESDWCKGIAPACSKITVTHYQEFLKELQQMVKFNSRIGVDELFALSPSSDKVSKLCCLPKTVLLALLRQLCNEANEKDFQAKEERNKPIQLNLVDILVVRKGAPMSILLLHLLNSFLSTVLSSKL